MRTFESFAHAFRVHDNQFRDWSTPVHTGSWQSIDISKRPDAEMRELLNITFSVPLRGVEDLNHWRNDIKPNLPWADRHFELERVSGQPLNPGTTWKEWPYAQSAAKFREAELFSHTYAERYWPKYAGLTPEGKLSQSNPLDEFAHNIGIRFPYGDLDELINLLQRDPLTRQAYLPIFFPEDTGVAHGTRVPCTLGYWFIRRHEFFHVYYPIRSCDFIRHYSDDVYLTVRLLLHILGTLRKRDPKVWNDVRPGMFTMWIGSFHMFINDWRQRYGKAK